MRARLMLQAAFRRKNLLGDARCHLVFPDRLINADHAASAPAATHFAAPFCRLMSAAMADQSL